MAKVRVYELAKELGMESKTLLAVLKGQGEFLRSASSTVEAPLVRRLRSMTAQQLQVAGREAGPGRPARRVPPASSVPSPPVTDQTPEAVFVVVTACDGREHPGVPVPPGAAVQVSGCSCGQGLHGPEQIVSRHAERPAFPAVVDVQAQRPAPPRPEAPRPLSGSHVLDGARGPSRGGPSVSGEVRISELAVQLRLNARQIQTFLREQGIEVPPTRRVSAQAADLVRRHMHPQPAQRPPGDPAAGEPPSPPRPGPPAITTRSQVMDLCTRLQRRPPRRTGQPSAPVDTRRPTGLHEVVFWAQPGTQQLIASIPAPHGQPVTGLPAEALLLFTEVTDFVGTPGVGRVRALSWRYETGTTLITLTAWTDSGDPEQPLRELATATVDATQPWDLPRAGLSSLTARWWRLLTRPPRTPATSTAADRTTQAPQAGRKAKPKTTPAAAEASGEPVSFKQWRWHTNNRQGRTAGWYGPPGEHLVRAHMRLAHVGPGGKEREFRLVRAHTRGGPAPAHTSPAAVTTVYVLDLAE